MLIEETSLLDRRRDDLIYGLENNAPVMDSDDDHDDHGLGGTVDSKLTEGSGVAASSTSMRNEEEGKLNGVASVA